MSASRARSSFASRARPPRTMGSRNRASSSQARAAQQATLDELKALKWLPDAVAEAVYEKIHAPPARPVAIRR